jgi:hypothetical protein
MLSLLIQTKLFKTVIYYLGPLSFYITPKYLRIAHAYLGVSILILAIVHTGLQYGGTYIAIAYAVSLDAMNQFLYLPKNYQPSYWTLAFNSIASITGLVMLLILITMSIYSLNFIRRKDFEGFWFTHMLWPLFIILACVHGLGNLLGPLTVWLWVLVPGAVFMFEYLAKLSIVLSKSFEIVDATSLGTDILKLEIQVPSTFACEDAQYV